MRKAIGAINAGEVEEAHTIRGFIQAIYEGTPLPSSSPLAGWWSMGAS